MVKKKAARVKAKVAKTTIKAKTRGRRPAPSPKSVASATPVNKAHEAALKVVTRTLKASEAVVAKVAAAEKKSAAAKSKVATATKAAAQKKSAATARAVVATKADAKTARSVLAGVRAKLVEAEKTVKDAVRTAEVVRKKDDAMAKAVAAFAAKWERDYDAKATMAAKPVKKHRAKVSKKKV